MRASTTAAPKTPPLLLLLLLATLSFLAVFAQEDGKKSSSPPSSSSLRNIRELVFESQSLNDMEVTYFFRVTKNTRHLEVEFTGPFSEEDPLGQAELRINNITQPVGKMYFLVDGVRFTVLNRSTIPNEKGILRVDMLDREHTPPRLHFGEAEYDPEHYLQRWDELEEEETREIAEKKKMKKEGDKENTNNNNNTEAANSAADSSSSEVYWFPTLSSTDDDGAGKNNNDNDNFNSGAHRSGDGNSDERLSETQFEFIELQIQLLAGILRGEMGGPFSEEACKGAKVSIYEYVPPFSLNCNETANKGIIDIKLKDLLGPEGEMDVEIEDLKNGKIFGSRARYVVPASILEWEQKKALEEAAAEAADKVKKEEEDRLKAIEDAKRALEEEFSSSSAAGSNSRRKSSPQSTNVQATASDKSQEQQGEEGDDDDCCPCSCRNNNNGTIFNENSNNNKNVSSVANSTLEQHQHSGNLSNSSSNNSSDDSSCPRRKRRKSSTPPPPPPPGSKIMNRASLADKSGAQSRLEALTIASARKETKRTCVAVVPRSTATLQEILQAMVVVRKASAELKFACSDMETIVTNATTAKILRHYSFPTTLFPLSSSSSGAPSAVEMAKRVALMSITTGTPNWGHSFVAFDVDAIDTSSFSSSSSSSWSTMSDPTLASVAAGLLCPGFAKAMSDVEEKSWNHAEPRLTVISDDDVDDDDEETKGRGNVPPPEQQCARTRRHHQWLAIGMPALSSNPVAAANLLNWAKNGSSTESMEHLVSFLSGSILPRFSQPEDDDDEDNNNNNNNHHHSLSLISFPLQCFPPKQQQQQQPSTPCSTPPSSFPWLRSDWQLVPLLANGLRFVDAISINSVFPVHVPKYGSRWPTKAAPIKRKERIKREDVVIVIDASHSYRSLLLNAALGMRQFGYSRFLCIAHDESAAEWMREAGCDTIFDAETLHDGVFHNCSSFSVKRTARWMPIMDLKFYLYQDLIMSNTPFIALDSDVFFIRDMEDILSGTQQVMVSATNARGMQLPSSVIADLFVDGTREFDWGMPFATDEGCCLQLNNGVVGFAPTRGLQEWFHTFTHLVAAPSRCLRMAYLQQAFNSHAYDTGLLVQRSRPPVRKPNGEPVYGDDAGSSYYRGQTTLEPIVNFTLALNLHMLDCELRNDSLLVHAHGCGHWDTKEGYPLGKVSMLNSLGFWKLSPKWRTEPLTGDWLGLLDRVKLQEGEDSGFLPPANPLPKPCFVKWNTFDRYMLSDCSPAHPNCTAL